MPSNLSPEVTEKLGRNVSAARALMMQLSGMDRIDALSALVTAATVIIEVNYPPDERLPLLQQLLTPTVEEWTVGDAMQQASRATKQ